MMTLKTGTPGSSKTLSAVSELAALIKRWLRKEEELRPVFVHGIKRLALPHFKLPVDRVEGTGSMVLNKDGKEVRCRPDTDDPEALWIVRWGEVPDGALVIIDEAQRVFPVRPPSQRVSPHVSWLNTHRHRGIDIVLISQHPKLLDNAVRRLVNKHQHYRRAFGWKRAVIYEWDSCNDNLDGFGKAVVSTWRFPAQAFKFYHSAEVHTKQKYALPKWLIIPAMAIPLGVVALPHAATALYGASTGKGISSSAVPARSPASVARASAPASAAAVGPVAAQAAASAASAATVKAEAPQYLGCIAMADRCECIGSDGRLAEVKADACRRDAEKSGGAIPYAVAPAGGRGLVASLSDLAARAVPDVDVPVDHTPTRPLAINAGDVRSGIERPPVNEYGAVRGLSSKPAQ